MSEHQAMASGRVVKSISGFHTVETSQGSFVAQVPGRLKQEWQSTDIVAVGDWVTISHLAEENAVVEEVAERTAVLARTRPAANARRLDNDRQQVLVANPDQVIFVLSTKTPRYNLRKLDRFLVVAEMNELPAIIVVNKVDLGKLKKLEADFAPYVAIGYQVLYTSAKEGHGIEAVQALLKGKISVLTGSSGVGKSRLLNAIQGGLGLKVGSGSDATGKGMHTTRYAELFKLEMGGYVADTPGIRGLALYDVEPEELDAYFREIAPLVASCQFSDCSHRHEPGCAVRAAIKNGRISPSRYDSYLRLRTEHEALENKRGF